MGFFDHIQKKGSTAIKAQPAQVRTEIVLAPVKPHRSPNSNPRLKDNRYLPLTLNAKRKPVTKEQISKPRTQNLRKRPSLAQPRLESDSDESSNDQIVEGSRKRVRVSTDVEEDTKRQVRCGKAFSDEDRGWFPMVHAADIASLSKPTKYKAVFPDCAQATGIFLQYPSASQQERYIIYGL